MDQDRPPPVAEEIARLPALGTPECETYIRANGERLRPETLVHILRAGAASGDTSLFEICGRLLIGRRGADGRWCGGHCEGIIMNLAKYYGFHTNRVLLREYRRLCHAGMWKAIYAGYAQKPFWEIAFYHCMKQKCIDVARALARRHQREQEQEQPLLEWREEVVSQVLDPLVLEDEVLGGMEKEALIEAIRRLPPRQAEAALLAWVEERPIEADTKDSVKNVMGISERRVYQLLEKARARLLQDPVIRAKKDEA